MNENASPRTICLVDDDTIYQFTARKIIQLVDDQQNILSFHNGKQAIDFLIEHASEPALLPDVLFLDINMPIMDGWDFLGEYEKVYQNFSKSITIYMVSSSIDEKDIQRSRQFPSVKDFIVKPMNKERFIEILTLPAAKK